MVTQKVLLVHWIMTMTERIQNEIDEGWLVHCMSPAGDGMVLVVFQRNESAVQ